MTQNPDTSGDSVRTSLWLALVLTLPTEIASARMRIWRSLKSLGCAVLRDGVYLLPARPALEQALSRLGDEIRLAGGHADLLSVQARDTAQHLAFHAAFDRRAEYSQFAETLLQAETQLSERSPTELNRLRRKLLRELESIRAIDFFPDAAAQQMLAHWERFNQAVHAALHPGEPQSLSLAQSQAIPRLNHADFQQRLWATRQRLWIDRVASAWLIRQFIDPQAEFLWLAQPADCPPQALGFDFDGARFTHVEQRVTFQVLLASFALDADAALAKLGTVIQSLDLATFRSSDRGGDRVGDRALLPAEAAGLEAILSGLRSSCRNDDDLLHAMTPVLDALYRHFQALSDAAPPTTTPLPT